jgi:hypothetical protein
MYTMFSILKVGAARRPKLDKFVALLSHSSSCTEIFGSRKTGGWRFDLFLSFSYSNVRIILTSVLFGIELEFMISLKILYCFKTCSQSDLSTISFIFFLVGSLSESSSSNFLKIPLMFLIINLKQQPMNLLRYLQMLTNIREHNLRTNMPGLKLLQILHHNPKELRVNFLKTGNILKPTTLTNLIFLLQILLIQIGYVIHGVHYQLCIANNNSKY